MSKKVLIIFFIKIWFIGNAFAHEDFSVTQDFDNVKVRIVTGYKYEEIEKVMIIGQLAAKLSKELNYDQTIFLDFHHYYVRDCIPNYFISYDDGSIIIPYSNTEEKWTFLESKAIVIRQVSRIFDVALSMKLIEHSILNLESVKSNQNKLEYNKNYENWRINSIDTSSINKIVNGEVSLVVKEVLKNKIFRRERDDFNGITRVSYYFQNNKFYVYAKNWQQPDTIILELDNIYQFARIVSYSALVFETPGTFHFISNKHNIGLTLSKQHTIKDAQEYRAPYSVIKLTRELYEGGIIAVCSSTFYEPQRVMIYREDQDDFIQDLDNFIDLQKVSPKSLNADG